MVRPVRLDHPNTFYHVLSRGNEQRAIFRGPRDYEKFTDTIKGMARRYQVEVHAYVLMTNHYHLLIRTRQANLSKAFQWLGLTYSVWFNRRHKRSGHLFQGRFKSFVVENDRYLNAMCLYIHRNPIRAKMVDSLLDYPWSSYPVYARARKKESWLTTSAVLGMYGGNRKYFIEAQRSYANEEKRLLDDLRYGLFLGTDKFVAQWKKRLKIEKHREKPQTRDALRSDDLHTVVEKVITAFEIQNRDLILRTQRGMRRPYRDLVIYVLCHLGLFNHNEIAHVFGVQYTSITEALKRAEAYMDTDRKIRRKVEDVLIDI